MRISSTFKRILKYIVLGIAGFFLVSGIAVWVVFKFKNEWLLSQMESYLNESQSGQLEIESLELSLFKSLPDVTILLNGIRYYQHPDSLRQPKELPLLEAEQLFVAFELIPLLKEEINISYLQLRRANVRMEQDRKGTLNWELALAPPGKKKSTGLKVTPAKPKTPVTKQEAPAAKSNATKQKTKEEISSAVHIELKNIEVSDVNLYWYQAGNRDSSVIDFQHVEAELHRETYGLRAELSSSQRLIKLFLNNQTYSPGNLAVDAELSYQKDARLLTLSDAKLEFGAFEMEVHGTYAHSNNRPLEIEFDASANDLKFLAWALKPDVLKKNKQLLREGDIYLRGKVFGDLKAGMPQADVSFGLRNLSWQANQKMAFHNIGFEGRFKTGPSADYSAAELEIKNLKGSLPGGMLNGAFRLTNFAAPYLQYDVQASATLDGYDEVFNLEAVSALKGSIFLKANFDGPLAVITGHKADSNRASSIGFRDIGFTLNKTKKQVRGLNGQFINRNELAILDSLRFSYGDNDILVSATLQNLLPFLNDRKAGLRAVGNFSSRQLFTKDFIPDTLVKAQVHDRISNFGFHFDLQLNQGKATDSLAGPELSFLIKDLSARLDKLSDIKSLTTQGKLFEAQKVLHLQLQSFHASLPYGTADVTGEMQIPRQRMIQFDANVRLSQFPWTYIKELVAEIQEGKEPVSKKIPLKEMEIATADLDLSASMVTYPFDIRKLTVKNGNVHFAMPGSIAISMNDLRVNLDHLLFQHPQNTGYITGLRDTKGTIAMKELKISGMPKLNLQMDLTGQNDQLDISFSSALQKAQTETGRFQLDFSSKKITYHLFYKVQQADLASLISPYEKRKVLEGKIDYSLDLRTSGSTLDSARQNLSADIEIDGNSIRLHGVDIDNVLRKYEKSQNFNLLDVGAVVVAGPVGLLATKGSDFVMLASVNLKSGQQTAIHHLYANWKLENRLLTTRDVAFSTSENLIAFDGQIAYASDSIPSMNITVVDKNGCSLMEQKVWGKFGDMHTGKISITKTVLGSVINFANAVVGKDCKPVYTGKVKYPKS